MMQNSALMQSYSLMKMSSEVTKTTVGGMPQKMDSRAMESKDMKYFVPPDRTNDYFMKNQKEFNRNMFPSQASPPPPMERLQSDQFSLGKQVRQ